MVLARAISALTVALLLTLTFPAGLFNTIRVNIHMQTEQMLKGRLPTMVTLMVFLPFELVHTQVILAFALAELYQMTCLTLLLLHYARISLDNLIIY